MQTPIDNPYITPLEKQAKKLVLIIQKHNYEYNLIYPIVFLTEYEVGSNKILDTSLKTEGLSFFCLFQMLLKEPQNIRSIFSLALYYDCDEIVRFLKEKPNFMEVFIGVDQNPFIILLLFNNREKMLKILLENKNLNSSYPANDMLYAAFRANYSNIIQLLLKNTWVISRLNEECELDERAIKAVAAWGDYKDLEALIQVTNSAVLIQKILACLKELEMTILKIHPPENELKNISSRIKCWLNKLEPLINKKKTDLADFCVPRSMCFFYHIDNVYGQQQEKAVTKLNKEVDHLTFPRRHVLNFLVRLSFLSGLTPAPQNNFPGIVRDPVTEFKVSS